MTAQDRPGVEATFCVDRGEVAFVLDRTGVGSQRGLGCFQQVFSNSFAAATCPGRVRSKRYFTSTHDRVHTSAGVVNAILLGVAFGLLPILRR